MGEAIASTKQFEANGKSYQLSQLVAKDWRELESFLQDEVMAGIKPMLDGLDKESKTILLTDAVSRRQRMRLGTTEFAEAIQTVKAVSLVAYMVLRGKQQISKEEVDTLLEGLTVEKAHEFALAMRWALGVTDDPLATAPKETGQTA